MSEIKIDSIEEALQELRAGKMIVVVDDQDRENEGDFVMAAEFVSAESITLMTRYASGIITNPMPAEWLRRLDLDLMVRENTESMRTAFTVTVDAREGTSTGSSAHDRALTMRMLANPEAQAADFNRPGHVNPLMAREGGVLRRAGHTEASVDLLTLAGMQPVAVISEIMNDSGEMTRLPELRQLADRFGLKLITIEDLIKYRLQAESLIQHEITVDMPTEYGHFALHAYRQINTGEVHMAMVKGNWTSQEPVLVRVHSSCATGDIFGSCRCDCGPQLKAALRQVEKEGQGVVLYMMQEGRGIGLVNKLRAYKLQEEGLDTVEANLQLGFKMDERDYGVGAQILRDLGVRKMRLMTNNPTKRAGLIGYGLEIVENVAIEVAPNPHNERYLLTKKLKMGHSLTKS
ncbi:MAG: bifunctional 3,4-dihydroxy-2-butanone-4-phosphate synthase/GTP cyclohydrolase II [Bacteroidetes bacterium]|nr:MAG: bifunctional 3,4-dihydroxy-2-butanone-4-phosphate synthase/GTP cyclohydrolase II [Bacteroidota bacterium]